MTLILTVVFGLLTGVMIFIWAATSQKYTPKDRTPDEAHEDWLKAAEYRGMSYEWIQEARKTYQERKRRQARATRGNHD